jgi:hypothetical protein
VLERGSPSVYDEVRVVVHVVGKGRQCVMGLRKMSIRVQCAEHTRLLREQHRPAPETVVLLAGMQPGFCRAAANTTG